MNDRPAADDPGRAQGPASEGQLLSLGFQNVSHFVAALQTLSQQTQAVHVQFLEGQEAAFQALQHAAAQRAGLMEAWRAAPSAFLSDAVVEHPLSLDLWPSLRSHCVGGRAVVPVAVTVEWMLQALAGTVGGHRFELQDLTVSRPLVVPSSGSKWIRVRARPFGESVELEIRDQEDCLFSRSRAVLPAPISQEPVALEEAPEVYPHDAEAIYRSLLFHGHHFRGIERVTRCCRRQMHAVAQASAPPSSWTTDPRFTSWHADPLVLDACLQLGALWSRHFQGYPALPMAIKRLAIGSIEQVQAPLYLILKVLRESSRSLRADLFVLDSGGHRIWQIDGVDWICDASLLEAFARRTIEP